VSLQTDIFYMIEYFEVYNINTGKCYPFTVGNYDVSTCFQYAEKLLDEKRVDRPESEWVLRAVFKR
jgi:hypothetical protein